MFTHYFQIWLFLATSGLLMLAVATVVMDLREKRANRKHNAICAIALNKVQTRLDNGLYSSLEEAETDLEFEIITLHAIL